MVISLKEKDGTKTTGGKGVANSFVCHFSFQLTGTWQLTASSKRPVYKVQSCVLNLGKPGTGEGNVKNLSNCPHPN